LLELLPLRTFLAPIGGDVLGALLLLLLLQVMLMPLLGAASALPALVQ
jgi:hypothetical protein